MRKILLGLLFLITAREASSQATITVGSASGAGNFIIASNVYGPMTSVSTGASWNRHAYIYASSLLTGMPSGSTINAIDFSRVTSGAAQGSLSGTVNFKIYLKNTSSTDFGASSVDWTTESGSATLIYNGDPTAIVGSTTGFKSFPASGTPFIYNGGNLEVLVEYSQSAAATGEVGWGYDNATTVAAYVDNQVKYITGTSGSPTNTLSSSNQRHPGMKITFTGPACSGTPTAGTSAANQTICGGNTTTLSPTGVSVGAGITYQWEQSSSSGGTYTPVVGGTGATTTSYTTPALSTTTYYRLKVTCTNSSQTVYSSPVTTVTVTAQPSSLPITMGFNTTSSFNECLFVATVNNVGTNGTPALSFASAAATTTVGGTTDPVVVPKEGDRMIRFNSYNADATDAMRLIFPAVTSTGTASVDVAFWIYELNGSLASTDNVAVQYSPDGTNWTTAPGTTTNITNASLAADGSQNRWVRKVYTLPAAVGNQATVYLGLLFTSGYGYHTFVDNVQFGATGSLPVTIYSFQGEKSPNGNRLFWTTSTEVNNKGFELERSADGKSFSSIGFVASKAQNGNSTTILNYSFTDEKALNGTNYYRLKQIDNDGKSSYSSVVVLKEDVTDIEISAVYPNPVRAQLNLTVNTARAERASVSVTDATGKVVQQLNTMLISGENIIKLNVASLATGTYYIRLVSDEGVKTTKFIKN